MTNTTTITKKEFFHTWDKTPKTIITDNLTTKEVETLISMRNSNFTDAAIDHTWVFDIIDEDPKTLRGVLASLVKKGIVYVDNSPGDHPSCIITDEGIKIFSDYEELISYR